jgi:hypothetical protein
MEDDLVAVAALEVNRDTHGQASASDATLINTSQCPDAG